MNFVGVDLHKKTIMVCVVDKDRKVICRRRLACAEPDEIRRFFAAQVPCQVVVEATASYEWFVQLVEPLAARVVLAHPKKLRIIAESTRKSDKIDATVLAEFLALDMIPPAYRPTPRQRAHRVLVRQRVYVQRRITAIKNKLRRIAANYNADREDLFTAVGQSYLEQLKISAADRFAVEQLLAEWRLYRQQLVAADKQLRNFAREAPVAEQEARAVLDTIPTVGPVTIDVVLSELGDVRRLRSLKKATAFAGLAPGCRESAGKAKQLGITKQGSRLLRWILIETAWRLVGKTRHWNWMYGKLKKRCGAKKSIVAVARRLWCMMVSMLRTGEPYRLAHA
jgi:transposase